MHSDRPSCFYCVQLLNHFAKLWSEQTRKPWRIIVSSHANLANKEWCTWSGDLPSGHTVPYDNMREYGRDDNCDRKLVNAELEGFTYHPGKPGKIIQTFIKDKEIEAGSEGEMPIEGIVKLS